jgi:acetate kinase
MARAVPARSGRRRMSDIRFLAVFNAGSSSLKAELFAREAAWRSRVCLKIAGIGRQRPELWLDGRRTGDGIDTKNHADAARLALERLCDGLAGEDVAAMASAHRIVHGGDSYAAPVIVDGSVIAAIRSASHLAPLHNPPALAVMQAVRARGPGAGVIAVFDTAFFRELPAPVRTYAIPERWRRAHGIRRFGFHGIAHQSLHRHFRSLSGNRYAPERLITLHLGQGCSMAAIRDGSAVDTSMGFTPLEGLIMGTRPGDLDAGILLHLLRSGCAPAELERALHEESGLLGLSGCSDDVRELLVQEAAGNPDAGLALAAFHHRIRRYLGAFAAVLGGVDGLMFGGGIGENAPVVRSRACAALGWLGLELDEQANAGCAGTARRISADSSAIIVFVAPVREEAAIAQAACAVLDIDPAGLEETAHA